LDHAYHTIAQAITAASSGDTVLVYGPHDYPVGMTLNKAITVTGVLNPTVSYPSGGTTVTISAVATLEDFTITGRITGINFTAAASGATLQRCILNGYTYGKGITITSGTVYILDNVISGGSWRPEGATGCIVSFAGSSVIASNILKNGARGIQLMGSGTPRIYNNTIVGHVNYHSGSVTKGGGIYVSDYSAPYIENNIIANNTADYGGAYYIDTYAHGGCTDMSNNTYYNNVSTVSGYIYYPTQETWQTIGVDGNNEDNPLFLSSTDLRLQSTSTCIGTGSNTYVTSGWKDLSGLPRILPSTGTVDRGCYEGASVLTNTRTVGDWVELRGKPVTGNFESSMFYIEETNRVNGVKILASSSTVPGDLATIAGQYVTNDSELSIDPTGISITSGSSSNIPKPLGMCNRSLGGINIGLRVKVWGKITSSAMGVYTIDDGSAVNTTVLWYGTPYDVDDYVAVTGVSCYGCVRATEVDYITTVEQLMMMQSSSSSMSFADASDNETRKAAAQARWIAFLEEQIASLKSSASLSSSQQSLLELFEMLLKQTK